jgi:NAD(P)-dependent dehydrogenase (short-subunit alcohol dehydrogenase family)
MVCQFLVVVQKLRDLFAIDGGRDRPLSNEKYIVQFEHTYPSTQNPAPSTVFISLILALRYTTDHCLLITDNLAMQFKNKVAIITGAGQGIGLEIARKLAEGGAKVVLNDLEAALAYEAAEQLGAENCTAMPGDSSDPELIEDLVSAAITTYGHLDIAIANAGITLFGDFFTYAPEDFYRVMQVNLGGTFFLAQAAANVMKQQSSGGTLLFMSSVTGHQAHKNLAAYGMSKAALEMLAKSLVVELSEFQINVNAIAPGATTTERTLADAEYERTWSRITPMGRPARVEDIAATALFLVSDAARHITGQTLIVDGGWTSVSPSPY